MGTSRLNDLPERRVISSMRESSQTAAEQKGSAQRVSGANLAYFTVESAAQFDWAGLLDGAISPGYSQARFIITLTSSTAVVPLADLAVVLYYSTDGVNWSEYTYQRGIYESLNGITPGIWRTLRPLPGVVNSEYQTKFLFQLVGGSSARIAFKCQAFCTDEVTISVMRTA